MKIYTPIQELIEEFKKLSKLGGDSGFVGRSALGVIEKLNSENKEHQHLIEAHTNGEEVIVLTLKELFPHVDFSKTDEEIRKIKLGIEPNETAQEYYNNKYK